MTTEQLQALRSLTIQAYNEYGRIVDYKNFRGDPMPKFEELPEKIQEAWFNAVDLVRERVLMDVERTVKEIRRGGNNV